MGFMVFQEPLGKSAGIDGLLDGQHMVQQLRQLIGNSSLCGNKLGAGLQGGLNQFMILGIAVSQDGHMRQFRTGPQLADDPTKVAMAESQIGNDNHGPVFSHEAGHVHSGLGRRDAVPEIG
jgi:hypothetical protein